MFNTLHKFIILTLTRQGRNHIRLRLAQEVFNPISRKIGYTIVADHFYQPIPNEEEIAFCRNKIRPVVGSIKLSDDRLDFVADLLSEFRHEFNEPSIISSMGYQAECSQIQSGDAEFLYSMVRYLKPKLLIEVGAGGSTLISMAALNRNHAECRIRTEFVSIDPFPKEPIVTLASKMYPFVNFRLIKKAVQEVDHSEFMRLSEKDILFVDSSHVFKPRSDVEFEFHNLYPNLNAGVYVHIHDIFLPYDYPYSWNAREYRFWNEQYFLETFLICNNKYEVVAPLAWINSLEQTIFTGNIHGYQKDRLPASFWMKAIR